MSNPTRRFHLNSRRRFLFIASLLVLTPIIGIWIYSATLPPLVWYISDPIDNRDRRIKVLVPRGWRIQEHWSHLPTGILDTNEDVVIAFAPPDSPLQDWLYKHLHFESGAAFSVVVYTSNRFQPGDGELNLVHDTHFKKYHFSQRYVISDHRILYGAISFVASDKAFYDSSHMKICTSFRIEPGSGPPED